MLGVLPYRDQIFSMEISTTLADLLTPLPVANPFLAMRATLLWWLGDKFEYGLPHGWQSWLRRWTVRFFFSRLAVLSRRY